VKVASGSENNGSDKSDSDDEDDWLAQQRANFRKKNSAAQEAEQAQKQKERDALAQKLKKQDAKTKKRKQQEGTKLIDTN
jgi:hypothetical protein